MDYFGLFWLIMTLCLFPFGYKPIIFLLSISSIFNASQVIQFGSTNVSLFFGLELVAIIRLILPYKNSGFPIFKDRISFQMILLILFLWLYTYVVSNIFSGMNVYAGYADSFEQNYYSGGLPLMWGKSNLIFLIYMSVHLVLALLIYKRRYIIDKDFYLKSILFSVIIFNIVGLLWLFKMDLYESLCLLMFNNPKFSIAVFNGDPRFHATFTEPSVAGLFIAVFAIPCILNSNYFYKIMGIFLIILGVFNASSTAILGLMVSFFIIYFYYFKSTHAFILSTIVVLLSFFVFTFLYFDIIFEYYYQKNISDSGLIRSDSNVHTLINFFESYMLGLGVGSIKASSLLISYFASFGIFCGVAVIYLIIKMIDYKTDSTSRLVLLLLMVSIFISFISIPEYTLAIIWNLIFASICCSNKKRLNVGVI